MTAHPYRTPAEHPEATDNKEETKLQRIQALLEAYSGILARAAREVREISATKEEP